MIIKTTGSQYYCAGAEQHKENIHLLDESGGCFTVIISPTVVEVIGGQIVVAEAPTPTQLDIVEAQVTYTAMMTDTLLEV